MEVDFVNNSRNEGPTLNFLSCGHLETPCCHPGSQNRIRWLVAVGDIISLDKRRRFFLRSAGRRLQSPLVDHKVYTSFAHSVRYRGGHRLIVSQ